MILLPIPMGMDWETCRNMPWAPIRWIRIRMRMAYPTLLKWIHIPVIHCLWIVTGMDFPIWKKFLREMTPLVDPITPEWWFPHMRHPGIRSVHSGVPSQSRGEVPFPPGGGLFRKVLFPLMTWSVWPVCFSRLRGEVWTHRGLIPIVMACRMPGKMLMV